MLLDKLGEFCNEVTLTAGAGTTKIIGSQVDLGTVPRDIGQGQPIYVQFSIDVAVSGGTTNQFTIVSDSTASLDTTEPPTDATVHYKSDVFTNAELVQGFAWAVALPMGDVGGAGTVYERFLGILNTDVGSASGGSISIYLTFDPHGWRAYPDASN